MTRNQFILIRSEINKRIKSELHPENCSYCGGIHDIKVSNGGFFIECSHNCCDELLRDANSIMNEIRNNHINN